ncbi:MAG TPA: YfhO family protein, partial [Bacteroidia bacterium]|nr:YfhO family protein [Bacteroidia bacterium]
LDAIDSNQEFVGNYVTAYFGKQGGTAGPVYVGAIICFLFVLGIFLVKDNLKWWLLAATVVSVFLSWGSNFAGFSHFFFNYFPGYNKFRAVSMILVIAELTMPILAMLTIREIVKDPGIIKAKIKLFYLAFALTGGLSLITWLMPTTFSDPATDENRADVTQTMENRGIDKSKQDAIIGDVEQARIAIVKSDAMRSFLFILLAAGLLFVYSRKPFSMPILAGALGVLMLIDMYGVASRYLSDTKGNYQEVKTNSFQPTAADIEIRKDKDPDYRVLNLTVNTWADGSTSYFHKSIGGYHGAKLKRIQELYDSSLTYDIRRVGNSFGQNATDSSIQATLARQSNIDMLNVKYLINGYYDEKRNVVYYPIENRSACGHAWFVRESKIVDDADAELAAVRNFAPLKTAIIDKKFESQISGFKPIYDSAAYIKLLSYEPNDLKYESSASSDQLAVFSEIYYDKGWNVYVDGKLSTYMRADYVLRAMKVPAGKHQIEFKFEPSFYYTGEKIALVGSLLLFLFIGGGIYMDRKERKAASPKAA